MCQKKIFTRKNIPLHLYKYRFGYQYVHKKYLLKVEKKNILERIPVYNYIAATISIHINMKKIWTKSLQTF